MKNISALYYKNITLVNDHNAKCHYFERYWTECRGASPSYLSFFFMLVLC
jgi:hypothetical protein